MKDAQRCDRMSGHDDGKEQGESRSAGQLVDSQLLYEKLKTLELNKEREVRKTFSTFECHSAGNKEKA